MPKTRTGWLNFLVLQWFWCRLGKIIDKGEICGWVIMYPIIPLTGWWNDKWPEAYKVSILWSNIPITHP
jgi:hypothetical protein